MAYLLGQSLLDLRSTVVGKSEVATFGNSNADATVRFYDADDPEAHAYIMGLSNNTFTVKKRDDGDTVFAVGTTNPTITKGFEVIGDINYTGNLLQNGETYISSQWTTCNVADSNVIIYGGAGIPSSVGIGTTNPLAPLHVEGNIYMTGVILQNGEEFVGGAGSINNLSTGSNFSYVPIYQPLSSGTKIITTNVGTAADRTLYTIPLSVGRYLISANIPFRNLDGLTLMDNQNWATLSLCRTPVNEAEPAISFQSIRINSDTELMMQPVTFIAEVNKRGLTYDVVVSGKGHRLEFGSTLHDARMRIVPIVPAAGLPDSTSVAAALQVSPAKLVERVTAASQSTFVVTQEGHFTASTSNVHVYLNGTKYVYVDATNKDYEFTLSYSYDPFPKIMNSIYTVTLEEPAVAGDIIDITVYPVATADTLYAAGYLFQNIEPNVSPGWNALMAGDGIRTPGTVIIDGNLIVQGQIIGGSNVAGFTTGTRYDVTNLTGVGAGLAVEWAESYPAPTLKPPTGGLWSPTSNVAWQRYAGNEVVINFNLLGTVAVAATSPSDVWSLSLPYHINPAIYANGALIGDWVISITAASVTSTYKGFGRVDTSMVDAIRIRYLQGTTEVGLVNIASGTTVAISGNVVYSTISMTGGVPVSFVPPEFRQEENGRLGINVGAGMPRAQLDIISSSDATALIVDAQDTGNSFEARVAGVPKMVIDSGGNVGFGTTDPRRQFHIEGDMLLTGRIVDSNMRDLWIPGSTLEWQATLSPPLFTLPSGGSLTYTLQQGRYRYIGNEVVYNVNMAGAVVSRPTSTSADFKLNIPYALSLANYPVATIIGELWLTVTTADGLSTNAFKAFAKSITNDANNAHIRFLSGTTEGSLSTMAAGTTFSLQGQLIYNSQLIANVNGIPPSYIPAPIVQDQVGRVGINMGNNSPTSALYVRGSTSAEPAIIVNQVASTGDILKFQKLGVDRLVISNAGNVGIGTTEPQAQLHIQGSCRLTQTGAHQYINYIVSNRDSTNQIWLLCASTSGDNDVQGTLHGHRKSGRYSAFEVDILINVARTTNDKKGYIKTKQVLDSASRQSFRLITCTYNGVSYMALEQNSTDAFNTTYVWFNGHIRSTQESSILLNLTHTDVTNISAFSNNDTLESVQCGVLHVVGNVGIGTTNPLQALHVLANARVDGNAILGDSVTADAHTVSGTMGVTYSGTGTALTVNQQGTGKLFEVQDGGVARVTVLDGGNVGIGLTNPGQKLHVVGDTRIEGNLIVNGTQTIVDTDVATTDQLVITNNGTGPALIVNQTGSGQILEFQDSGVSVLTIIDGGNVGIGTTNPLQKLHVNGTVQAPTFLGALSGNASTATTWETTRTIALAGNVTAAATNINGSANVSLTTTVANDVITNAMVNSSAAIVDSKLATISTAGKVSNSATTATSANTVNAIVARDASGNFTAGTVTAALTGNASTATTLQTARTINGTSFNGSANITLTANTPSTLSRGSYLTGADFNGGSATTWAVDATDANTANKIVARNASGDFAAGQITAKRVMPYSGVSASDWYAAAIEVRELNLAGAQTGVRSEAPRIGFHWSNRVASQIMMEASGQIAVVNNPGTSYEKFAAGETNINGALYVNGDIQSPVLVGQVSFFARNAAPTGWLKANGATISRTTYAALFTAIGTTFGVGNGSTTFVIPDLRGEFIRGWADNRAVDTGRGFGSLQDDALQNITGTLAYAVYGGGGSGTGGAFAMGSIIQSGVLTTGGSYSTFNVSFDASRMVKTSTETRPRNVSLLACIKF